MSDESTKIGKKRGQKPIALVAQAGYLKPQDAIWATVRKLKIFTQKDIDIRLNQDGVKGINSDTLRSYIKRLEKGGYVKIISSEMINNLAKRLTYELINDVGVHSPRITKDGKISLQGRGRENLWRSMKVLKTFDYVELTEAACTDEVTVKEGEAKDYVKHLFKAGYLIQVADHNPKTGTKSRYQLLKSKNTGALPPVIQRTKRVFDQNLREVVWREQEKTEGCNVKVD